MSWLREAVLRHADIVEVVSEYLPLKKKGANYWSLSPFKPEKTPSFAVSPTKQIFKCFSTGKGGDVIRFVMEMEGLSYREALHKLAQRYNIPLPQAPDKALSQTKERQRYIHLYQETLRFYRAHFAGSPAEAYIRQRGLLPETIEVFQLGYAPPDGQALADYLLRLGYAEELLIQAGLVARSENTGRLYDRFRGRVIFPIQDEQGVVIAFAGRSLGTEEPKYLNSPDTPFYQKSDILYGLYQARSALRKDKPALVVEGYMDVISLHQAGFPEAVATCGTALTTEHLHRLKRYTRRLIFLYDNDEAGHSATQRATLSALSAGFFVSVAPLSSAKDPDELIKTQGPAALRELLQNTQTWPIFFIQHIPHDTPEQRYQLIQKLGEALHTIPDPVLRRVYAEEIERALKIPLDFWDSYARVERPVALAPHFYSPQRITAERELLRMALSYPTAMYGGIPVWRLLQEELRHLSFADSTAEKVRRVFCDWVKNDPPIFSDLAEQLEPEAQDWLSEVLMERYTLSPHWQSWDDSPLEEDVLRVVETNLNLLHLNHIQQLLEENLSILRTLEPESPTYNEHLVIHQVLLKQRVELAQQSGLLLPYHTIRKEA
ncbi:MAG: DNA primase [Bacteroidia bacterium]|nr:DNA primase [Bacteroidia bacterium]